MTPRERFQQAVQHALELADDEKLCHFATVIETHLIQMERERGAPSEELSKRYLDLIQSDESPTPQEADRMACADKLAAMNEPPKSLSFRLAKHERLRSPLLEVRPAGPKRE